jgi:hypothetical protein
MCLPQGHGTNASALCRGSNACMHDRVDLPAVHLIEARGSLFLLPEVSIQ